MTSFNCFYPDRFTLYTLVQFALMLSTSPNMAVPYFESSMQHHTTLRLAISHYNTMEYFLTHNPKEYLYG